MFWITDRTYSSRDEIFKTLTDDKKKEKYSKTYIKRPLSRRSKMGFQDQLSLNAGQQYCGMLQGEHSAIRLAFIKLPFVIKIFVLSIFEWPFYTGFTVPIIQRPNKIFTMSIMSIKITGYQQQQQQQQRL